MSISQGPVISSLANEKIKVVLRLAKAGARKKRSLIIIDGEREISAAAKAGLEIPSLFYCPTFSNLADAAVRKIFHTLGAKINEVSPAVFKKICYKEKPDGFLALARPKFLTLKDLSLGEKPLVIILENVEKPGNLGAILRTAYAAQVGAVIINEEQTDIYNPNVIRASEGLVFLQPLVVSGREETLKWLKINKIKSLAASTGGRKNYWQADLSGPAAIILGTEAAGLSPAWLKAADEAIKIPMRSGLDSLNVSVAAALIVFEAKRQRRSATS